MQSATLDIRPLADRAHAEIRRLILSGELPPASSIAEEGLALRLGISRTPIREALRRLSEEGLVAAGERQRARVATLTADEAAGVMAVRAVLDALAAEGCAGRCDASTLDDLRRRAAQIDELLDTGDIGAAFAADGEFHRALGAASGNAELRAHLARIDGRVQLVRLTCCAQRPADVRQNTARHHELIAAIAAGDGARAAAIAREHALVHRS